MSGKKYITILMDYDNMNYAGSNGGSANNSCDISDTLKQGLQFQKYLKNISGFGAETLVEQFVPISDREKQQKLAQLEDLKRDYFALINNFESSGNTLRAGYNSYLSALPVSTYANKHVTFNEQNGYVNRRGVFKSYDGSGNSFNDVNGCPSTSERLRVTGSSLSDILSSNRLTRGGAMEDGKNCGDEGTNVVVTDFGVPGITYKGCYQATDTAFTSDRWTLQEGGAIYNVNSCKNRAVDTGAALFALRNVDPSLNKAQCYTGATFVSPTLFGDAYVGTTLWSSADTPKLSGAFLFPYKMQLKNGGFISIIDSSSPPQLVKQIKDNRTSACQIIPRVTKFYETPATTTTPPVNLIATTEDALNTLNRNINPDNVPSFSFQISAIYPNVPVSLKNYTLVYTCGVGGVEIKKEINGGNEYRFVISCENNTSDCVDYYLTLTGDKMQINKGLPPTSTSSATSIVFTSPSYASSITSSVENPSYPISGGINSNRISGNVQLSSSTNDYITSSDGKLVLIMQSDGHLVLKTFEQKFKCSTRAQDGKSYGDADAYALYNFTSSIDNSNIGKLAYIDEDGSRHEYPSSMISREQGNYKRFQNFKSDGNNVANMPIENSSNNACKLASDNMVSSGGYVYDNNTKKCWIKNSNFNLKTPKVYSENVFVNVKRPVPIVPVSCSDTLTEIDSTRWSKYKSGSDMTSSFSCGASNYYSGARQNVRTIEEQLYVMAIDIVNKMNELQSQGVTLSSDMIIFKTQLRQSIDARNAAQNNDNVVNSALSGMMSDVDLMVLQENTRYLFLSIFAVGAMVVALNAIKK
jgi:hypothetical protein